MTPLNGPAPLVTEQKEILGGLGGAPFITFK